MTELLKQGYELKAVWKEKGADGWDVERLYLQKSGTIVVCVMTLKPPMEGERRDIAFCVVGLYEGQ